MSAPQRSEPSFIDRMEDHPKIAVSSLMVPVLAGGAAVLAGEFVAAGALIFGGIVAISFGWRIFHFR